MKPINELVADLHKYNKAYRLGKPLITDQEYDSLVAQLKEADPDNEWFSHVEPAPVSNKRRRRLPIPMKSLNKVKTFDEILQWVRSLGLPPKTSLVIMPKYDGISWLHDEINHHTYSRGGAENEGQDCHEHFETGKFLELEDHDAFPVNYTFGELMITVSDWEQFFANRLSPYTGNRYKSPRNTVAGLINRDFASDELKYTTFVRYGADETSLFSGKWGKFSDFLQDLCYHFHQPACFCRTQLFRLDDEKLISTFRQWREQYYIDGVVIYINDLLLWDKIGRQQTSGNPLYAIAYKNPAFTSTYETEVIGIDWAVSKSGALKPVVKITPVDTGDCIMENPTGYNAKWVKEHYIAPGAKILVTRSGGVIPKILQIIEAASPEAIDKQNECLGTCPVCGSPTAYDENGAELCCTNPDCDGKRLAKINHFFKTVGCEKIGEETISKMFDAGLRSIKAILDSKTRKLLQIEGFAEGIVSNIKKETERIKKGVDLATLMHASDCFKGIGTVKAKAFLANMSLEVLHDFINGQWLVKQPSDKCPDFSSEAFQQLPATIQNFFKGYEPFMAFLEETQIPPVIPEIAQPSNDRYHGFKVCFSGIRDKALENAIVDGCGMVMDNVSKNTTHLVVRDPHANTSKIAKAKSLGIPIMTVDAFRKI